jgi:mannose-1-phosphate guanylyltransferase
MVVLPADHWVADVNGFRSSIRSAVEIATRHDSLVTIGIRPNYPETGYGYIMKGKPLGGKPGAYHVKRFHEKPSVVVAQQLIHQGSLWNSGIFVWKASLLLELLQRYQPTIARGLEQIKKAARGKSLGAPSPRVRSIVAREYKKMPNISIDYAILEKAGSEGKVITLEADFGWSDVGSWAAFTACCHDENGNAGTAMAHSGSQFLHHAGIGWWCWASRHRGRNTYALLVGDINDRKRCEVGGELKKKGYGAYTIK